MLTEEQQKLIDSAYLSSVLEPELIQEIILLGEVKEIETDRQIMHRGDPMRFIPILLSGTLRVMREDKDGKEILLYYLESGETCAITLKCCTSRSTSKVSVIAEEPSILLTLPLDKMDRWLAEYGGWRNFVLGSFDDRLNEMIETIDALAFTDLETRLKKYLMNRVWINHDRKLSISHKKIAQELNTSREVVSRLMKKLENKEIIEQKRNEIIMLQELTLR